MIVLYILIAILLFGFLIFIHELGHFICARIFKVTVNEFALGMGPKIFSVKSKKSGTAYSLRLFPVGGFVSMLGEDETSEEEGSLNKKPVWQRMIITAAGAFMNLLTGVIVMSIIVLSMPGLGGTTVAEFEKNASSVDYLEKGDEIIYVAHSRVHIGYDVSYAISRFGNEPVDITVIRDGEQIVIKDVIFSTKTEQEINFGVMDFKVYRVERTFGNLFKQTFYYSVGTIRMIVDSLVDLICGKYGFKQLSGPVGVTEAITDAASDAVKTGDGTNLWYLFVVLAMNLGIVNMLPLPALDGGRVFFMLIELIFRKPVNRKAEAIIHFVGIIILLALMFAVSFKDIFYLIGKK